MSEKNLYDFVVEQSKTDPKKAQLLDATQKTLKHFRVQGNERDTADILLRFVVAESEIPVFDEKDERIKSLLSMVEHLKSLIKSV